MEGVESVRLEQLSNLVCACLINGQVDRVLKMLTIQSLTCELSRAFNAHREFEEDVKRRDLIVKHLLDYDVMLYASTYRSDVLVVPTNELPKTDNDNN